MQTIQVHCIYMIQRRLGLVDCLNDMGERRFRVEPQIRPDRIEAFGTQSDLRGALFGADVQSRVFASGEELE